MNPSPRHTRAAAVAGALLALPLVPGIAQAHVTVNPNQVAQGSELELAVRVPSESDTASTNKIAVQLPPGFITVSYEAEPGWKVDVKKSKLAKPVTTDDGVVTEQVDSITWTGTGKGDGEIPPGAFKDFPISVEVPGKAGDTLTCKAVQTYSDGSVVRWIGPPSADQPAPTVKILPAGFGGRTVGGAAAAGAAGAAGAPGAPGGFPAGGFPGRGNRGAVAKAGASKGLAYGALGLGIVGVLLGGAALARSSRKAA